MHLKIVDNYPEAISEDGLIDVLMGKSYQPPKKPVPDKGLALQAMDFWIEEWHMQGVEVLSAELQTEFDPEESYWYFVIELTIELNESIKESCEKEYKIISKMASIEPTPQWVFDFTVITNRREKL